jgi:CheY-like chemotaxis protein
MAAKRILIIDNEPMMQEVAQISLETVAGWDVTTASSGQEGLAKAQSEQPDVILLDVMMPDMDGITTFEKLQANPVTQPIPVILLTARMQPSDQVNYKNLGLAAAIAKPFEPLTLATEIAQALSWTL